MVLSSAIVCDRDRRIADDRRSSFHMIADDRRPYCDLRSAICDRRSRSYGNDRRIADDRQLLDRTWFYMRSQTIADLIAICDLRSAIIWKPALRLSQRDNLLLRLLLPATTSKSGSASCTMIPKQQNFTKHDERFDFSAISGCHIGLVHVTFKSDHAK